MVTKKFIFQHMYLCTERYWKLRTKNRRLFWISIVISENNRRVVSCLDLQNKYNSIYLSLFYLFLSTRSACKITAKIYPHALAIQKKKNQIFFSTQFRKIKNQVTLCAFNREHTNRRNSLDGQCMVVYPRYFIRALGPLVWRGRAEIGLLTAVLITRVFIWICTAVFWHVYVQVVDKPHCMSCDITCYHVNIYVYIYE